MAYDPAQTIIPHGKKLEYSDGGGTPTWLAIETTVDITLPEDEVGETEITNDSSPDFTREHRPALVDPGEVEVTYVYTRVAFDQMEDLKNLHTVAASRASAVKSWRLTLPDGSTVTFKGWVKKNGLPLEGAEESPQCEASIRTTGKRVFTPAA